jgi:hypothetical protein
MTTSEDNTNVRYLINRDRAAFSLYKHEHPESVAESWETVGLPIVLAYREKAGVVLTSYFGEASHE